MLQRILVSHCQYPRDPTVFASSGGRITSHHFFHRPLDLGSIYTGAVTTLSVPNVYEHVHYNSANFLVLGTILTLGTGAL